MNTPTTRKILSILLSLFLLGSNCLPVFAKTQNAATKTPVSVTTTAPADTSFAERIPLIALIGQRLISYLGNLRSAIERTEGLNDSEKTSIIANINQHISYLQAQTITISNAQTENELNQKFNTIIQYWQDKQNTVTYYLSLITGNMVQQTISRFRTVQTKTDLLIGRLRPNQSVTVLEKQFKTAIDAADASYAKAQGIFNQIKTPGDHKALLPAGLQAFRDAHAHLQEARDAARKLIASLQTIVGSQPTAITSTPSIQP